MRKESRSASRVGGSPTKVKLTSELKSRKNMRQMKAKRGCCKDNLTHRSILIKKPTNQSRSNLLICANHIDGLHIGLDE
jgi:hypothetical protein